MRDDYFGFIDGRIPPTVYSSHTFTEWCAAHGYDPASPRALAAYNMAPRSADPAPAVPE
jgi:hypothetical protein